MCSGEKTKSASRNTKGSNDTLLNYSTASETEEGDSGEGEGASTGGSIVIDPEAFERSPFRPEG